jgi:hypothetical protein
MSAQQLRSYDLLSVYFRKKGNRSTGKIGLKIALFMEFSNISTDGATEYSNGGLLSTVTKIFVDFYSI